MPIDLAKSYECFQPEKRTEKIHIVGIGSGGLTVAEMLVRSGITNLVLWDFDTVESHNLANQLYRQQDVGKLKVEAAREILTEINDDIADTITLKPKGWDGQNMSGIIFLNVDNIDLRRRIVEQHYDSPYVTAMFDCRNGLKSGQTFAADWLDTKMKEDFLATMSFSHEEAKDETPVSACNVSLAVVPTIRTICSLEVANFMNWWNGEPLKRMILCDPYSFEITAF